MRFTQYIMHARNRPDRRSIELAWIEDTVREPDAEQRQQDGRIRRRKRIAEADGRFLRVVLLPDGETIHMHSSTGDSEGEDNAGEVLPGH